MTGSIDEDGENKDEFIDNQKQRMNVLLQTSLAQQSAIIKEVDVDISPPNHEHAYAGTTNSECRSPGDDFFPVETRITIDNKDDEGMVSCSYTVDLHRQKIRIVKPPSP